MSLDPIESAALSLERYYATARQEIEALLSAPNLTLSETAYFTRLLSEVEAGEAALLAGASAWVNETIPAAYSAGAILADPNVEFTVTNDLAVRQLSQYSLDLVTQTTLGMRLALRSEIAQGLLQGLSGEELRKRLLATGLSNIPRWPSVDYRAGVIARTEMMRAYNFGIDAGFDSVGAVAYVWITSPDSNTCHICSPRSGKTYLREGTSKEDPRVVAFDAAYGGLTILRGPPAHPRCRCTMRAQFRFPGSPVLPAERLADESAALRATAEGNVDAMDRDMLAIFGGRSVTDEMMFARFPAAPGGDLSGLDWHLKDELSILRKLTSDMQASLKLATPLTPGTAALSLSDAVRYSVRLSPGEYTTGVRSAVADLTDQGYTLLRANVSWEGQYAGANYKFRSPTGQTFEVQFHTADSIATARENHVDYEIWRKLDPTSPEALRLDAQMQARVALLGPAPDGFSTLP